MSSTRNQRCTELAVGLLLACISAPPAAVARGTVGTGTPDTCTEPALDVALRDGGPVTFDCGRDPTTITVTSEKQITKSTNLDGANRITLSGGGSTLRFASVSPHATLTLAHVTISDFVGAVINQGGSVSVTESNLSNNIGLPALDSAQGHLAVTASTFSNNAIAIVNGRYPLTVTNCTFSNNDHAIANGPGSLTVTNSRFLSQTNGAIQSQGKRLTVMASTFSGNSAAVGGGAISNVKGRVTLTNNTFSGNSAAAFGGAIYHDAGALTIANSSFINNSVADGGVGGGAIYNNSGKFTVTNSTFYSNTSGGAGGAIYVSGQLSVTNSTIANNGAVLAGGAIYLTDGKVTLRNTIVANSASGENCGLGVGGFADRGHNLDSGGSCGFSTSKDSLSDTDPQLDPTGPAENGGPTQTVAVLAGSPAIGAGNRTVCGASPVRNLDQRGFGRPGTGSVSCTIGAYEFNSPEPTIP